MRQVGEALSFRVQHGFLFLLLFFKDLHIYFRGSVYTSAERDRVGEREK